MQKLADPNVSVIRAYRPRCCSKIEKRLESSLARRSNSAHILLEWIAIAIRQSKVDAEAQHGQRFDRQACEVKLLDRFAKNYRNEYSPFALVEDMRCAMEEEGLVP